MCTLICTSHGYKQRAIWTLLRKRRHVKRTRPLQPQQRLLWFVLRVPYHHHTTTTLEPKGLCILEILHLTMLARHSGLQKEVFSLFRKILRVAAEKDRALLPASTRPQHFFVSVRNSENTSTAYACKEFRRQASQVKRSDFKRIEHMIRKGEKHLKLLKMPGVQNIRGTQMHA